MNSRGRVLAGVLVVPLLVCLVGCGPRTASPAVRTRIDGSAPGQYTGPVVIRMANGTTMTVPSGWVAQIEATGALTNDAIRDGAEVMSPDLRMVCAVSVVATNAANSDFLPWESGGASVDEGIATSSVNGKTIIERTTSIPPVRVSDGVTVTAVVRLLETRPVARRTRILVEERGRVPLNLDIWSWELPGSFGAPTAAQLPLLWLSYFHLLPR